MPILHLLCVHTVMEWFNDEGRKRSEGRSSIDIYPNAQLMFPDQEMSAQH